ncbi:hypothetical protein QBD00_003256 [Ochrobactrum sp. AN78]|nr:hypothetical protein [Ochrobactrum sp. AN78]
MKTCDTVYVGNSGVRIKEPSHKPFYFTRRDRIRAR